MFSMPTLDFENMYTYISVEKPFIQLSNSWEKNSVGAHGLPLVNEH